MPELPEIEHLRRTLEPILAGARVSRVRLLRQDMLRSGGSAAGRTDGSHLLSGRSIATLARHGKELAIVAADGRAICVHLGMSGQLRFCPANSRPPRADHVHCIWSLESRRGAGRLFFRDPRRFGGLWAFPSIEALRAARWSRLGPDALGTTATHLRRALTGSRRAIKAALLDQRLIAGVGNIYADEALFTAGIHPRRAGAGLDGLALRRLASAIRTVLRHAIRLGGSTIRDYVDGRGDAGGFATLHRVYGRGSLPCLGCSRPLRTMRIAQRTTVFCPACQPMPRRSKRRTLRR